MNSDTFTKLYTGSLKGILNSSEYEQLIKTLKGDYYGIDFSNNEINGLLNAVYMSKEEVKNKLIELRKITQSAPSGARVSYPYTYVKEKRESLFIKTYNPAACGGSCSTKTPDPWWVFSALKPEPIELERLRPKAKTPILKKLKSAFL